MTDQHSSTTPQFTRTITVIATTLVLALSACLYFRFVLYTMSLLSYPHLWEYREFTSLGVTDLLLRGINPYSGDYVISHNNPYGILYSLCVMPVAAVVGNDLFIHRLLSAVCLALFAVLVGYTILRTTKELWLAWVAPVFLVASPKMFYFMSLCRPDALAILLGFVSVFCIWLNPSSRWHHGWSALWLFLGFATKTYVAIAFPVIVAFLWIQRDWRALCSFVMQVTVVFLVGCAALFYFCGSDYFFAVLPQNMVMAKLHTTMKQGKMLYAQLFSELGAVWLVVVLGLCALRRVGKQRESQEIGFWQQNALWLLATGVITLFVLPTLFNEGGGIYYCYLFLPYLLILFANIAARFPQLSVSIMCVVAFNLMFLWSLPVAMPHKYADDAGWMELDQVVQGKQSVLNIHDPMTSYILWKHGHRVYDAGNLISYLDFRGDRQEQFAQRINERVANQEFDLVFWVPWSLLPNLVNKTVLDAHYQFVGDVTAPVQQGRYIQTWMFVPRPRTDTVHDAEPVTL